MANPLPLKAPPGARAARAPLPIVALDVPAADDALALVERLPEAGFFKVGLQLYTAAGAEIVRTLKARGHGVFLDLKLHDIPNTVAGAVRAAGALGVDLLTVHASGGLAMLRAASAAAEEPGMPRLLAVTVLTSLTPGDLELAWGRTELRLPAEAARLAALADSAGFHGVVTSLHEVAAIRGAIRPDLPVLTPGIRLPGDDPGDQARIGTPADAAALAVDYIVLGRTVSAAANPAAAFRRVLDELARSPGDRAASSTLEDG